MIVSRLPSQLNCQVPYISTSLCAEKLHLNYFQGLGNTLLGQRCELRHEAAFHNRQLYGLSTVSLALSSCTGIMFHFSVLCAECYDIT
jgi:hypothetical protein